MKVLIDTNVLYSAFIRKSEKMAKLIVWVMVNHDAVITPEIANEILEKVEIKAPESLEIVTSFLSSNDLQFVGSVPRSSSPHPAIRDKDDQSILDAALDHGIDVIITGDKDFHALDNDRPRILTPADFIAKVVNQQD